MDSDIAIRFAQRLEAFAGGLSGNLGSTLALGEAAARKVLDFVLESACRSQRLEAIELGRRGLLSMPRSWVVENIESAASTTLDLADEYEYRRLLEVAVLLGSRQVVKRLTEAARVHEDPELSDTAMDFADFATEPEMPKVRKVALPGYMVREPNRRLHAAATH